MHQKQIERLSDKQVARDRISNSDDNYYNKYLKQTGLSENKVYPRPIESFLVQNPFNITPPNQSDLRNKVNPPTHSKLKSFEFCNQIFL
ncbi:unnamed protein product [Schistosoma curassoni]|uniref:Uncharacterized protein n=1 Tax=Schistosoma curassoni TaxID=6186 RepID=A0A183JL76_9TREM|nr:unnamed protein product [Schistosoma curassoni]